MKNLHAGTFQEIVNTSWLNWFPQTLSGFMTMIKDVSHACYQLIFRHKQRFQTKHQTMYEGSDKIVKNFIKHLLWCLTFS